MNEYAMQMLIDVLKDIRNEIKELRKAIANEKEDPGISMVPYE